MELASHQNEVLSKDRLLETVWHNTFVGEDALVRCISEIRNVFRDDPKSSRVIQTIPKSGYRLIATVTVDARKPGSSSSFESEPQRAKFQSTFPRNPAEQLKFVTESFTYCSGIIPNLTEQQLATTHSSPDGVLLGREILLVMYVHVAHHRGQAEVYLRDKGIKPPSFIF